MATQTTKPRKKTTTGSNTKSRKRYAKKRWINLSHVQYEVLVMITLLFSLFVIVSIYFTGGGLVGQFIRDFFFGVFGFSAWLIPILIFGFSFLKVFNEGNERLNVKLLLIFIGLVFLSVFFHILYAQTAQIQYQLGGKNSFLPALANYYKVSSTYKMAGGFIGGLIGDIFIFFLGKVGSIFIIVLVYIALFVTLTEKSFVAIIRKMYQAMVGLARKGGQKIGDKVQQRNQQKQEQQVQQRQQEKQERQVQNPDLFQDNQTIVETNAATVKQKKNSKNRFLSILRNAAVGQEDSSSATQSLPTEPELGLELKSEADQVPINAVPDASQQPAAPAVEAKPNRIKAKSDKQSDPIIDKQHIEQEILKEVDQIKPAYKTPPFELLKSNPLVETASGTEQVNQNAQKLEEILDSFGVKVKVVNYSIGPTVTRYELQPDQGVKVSKIVNLTDDIALNLAAAGIRIEAPIPGKSAVGIEVPNKKTSSVYLREVVETDAFQRFPSDIPLALGKDISGQEVISDIAKMPHLLIAGATGSGKSVCVNTLITSILYKSSPEQVKLLMIDPKVVELSIYNGIPHLLIPVVTDPKKAASALNWAVQEMLDRYKLFALANVRDLSGYNKAVVDNPDGLKKLPKIVIIVDELADLMVACANEVEEAICRLAQMARACGIHLIIATQRPSVDVITGLIKANIPSRIAFNVSSGVDSRTIIDMNGAEKLLGKGDMLFSPVGLQKPLRVQGAFISDKEVSNIVAYLKTSKKQEYDKKIINHLNQAVSNEAVNNVDLDGLFEEVLELCVKQKKASASMIQRKFRVGYNRAARIMDQLYEAGYVGEEEGSKPRKMLLTPEQLEQLRQQANSPAQEKEQLDEAAAVVAVEETDFGVDDNLENQEIELE